MDLNKHMQIGVSTFALITMAIVVMVPSCGPENSKLKGLEDPGGTYIEDCDRHLARSDDGRYALSHVGCIVYGNGAYERPAYLPAIDDKIRYFKQSDGADSEVCDLKESAGKLIAECSSPVVLGELDASGTVLISSKLSFHIVLRNGDRFKKYNPTTDEKLLADAEISFTLR